MKRIAVILCLCVQGVFGADGTWLVKPEAGKVRTWTYVIAAESPARRTWNGSDEDLTIGRMTHSGEEHRFAVSVEWVCAPVLRYPDADIGEVQMRFQTARIGLGSRFIYVKGIDGGAVALVSKSPFLQLFQFYTPRGNVRFYPFPSVTSRS